MHTTQFWPFFFQSLTYFPPGFMPSTMVTDNPPLNFFAISNNIRSSNTIVAIDLPEHKGLFRNIR